MLSDFWEFNNSKNIRGARQNILIPVIPQTQTPIYRQAKIKFPLQN